MKFLGFTVVAVIVIRELILVRFISYAVHRICCSVFHSPYLEGIYKNLEKIVLYKRRLSGTSLMRIAAPTFWCVLLVKRHRIILTKSIFNTY